MATWISIQGPETTSSAAHVQMDAQQPGLEGAGGAEPPLTSSPRLPMNLLVSHLIHLAWPGTSCEGLWAVYMKKG